MKAVLEIISKSAEPLHEELNGLLKELSSDPIFYELNSSPEFSMEAVLDSVITGKLVILNHFLCQFISFQAFLVLNRV